MSNFKEQLRAMTEAASRKKAYIRAQSRLEKTGEPQAFIVRNGEWFTTSWSLWKISKDKKLVSVIHRSQKWNA